MMFDFVDGATGGELAAANNPKAIDAARLQPRVLIDVHERQLHTNILGMDVNQPFGVAPMGMCNLTWPSADNLLAAEAVRSRMPLGVSCAASTSLEDMHRLAGPMAWFQLYVGQSFEAAFEMVERAKVAGYEVLVLTVDVPQVASRVRDLKNGFRVPFHIGPRQFFDFATHPRWSIETLLAGVPKPMTYETASGAKGFVRGETRGLTDWLFLQQLRECWPGKLVVKGVLHVDDAKRIADIGCDAVYVSNHGGRQLDSAPSAISVLPAIRAGIGEDFPILFDSGVRSGEAVVKALALGANFVLMGRPFMYAIGADGARGLSNLVEIVRGEIDVTLAQLGVTRIEDVDANVLFKVEDNHPKNAVP